MFRRVVASLLVLGYIAGQLASLPHAHAAWDAEHENLAHLHSGWFTSWFSKDGHSHGCGHHSHVEKIATAAATLSQQQGHEHDCILLPDPVDSAPDGKNLTATAELGHCAAIFATSSELVLPSERRVCDVYPLDELASPLALYLALRNLRI